jgi:hypothetical protein
LEAGTIASFFADARRQASVATIASAYALITRQLRYWIFVVIISFAELFVSVISKSRSQAGRTGNWFQGTGRANQSIARMNANGTCNRHSGERSVDLELAQGQILAATANVNSSSINRSIAQARLIAAILITDR